MAKKRNLSKVKNGKKQKAAAVKKRASKAGKKKARKGKKGKSTKAKRKSAMAKKRKKTEVEQSYESVTQTDSHDTETSLPVGETEASDMGIDDPASEPAYEAAEEELNDAKDIETEDDGGYF